MRVCRSYIILIIALAFLLRDEAKAQFFFWTETWIGSSCLQGCTTYTGLNGAWTINNTLGVNGATPNKWYFSQQEQGLAAGSCGAVGTPISAHIGNDPNSPNAWFWCPTGDCGASYDAGACDGTQISHTRLESPTINCTGATTITLSFTYITNGDATDYCTVYWYNGVTWATLPALSKLICAGGQGKWQNYSTVLPAGANNNANVKVGFYWVNDDDCLDFSDADPSVAIYNVQLSIASGLPIDLLSFSAKYDNAINIDWSTASETNNKFFTIEKSVDGENWQAIATVAGAGNSDQTRYYSMSDNFVLPGTLYYYRLKQTDFDGHYTYFTPINITVPDNPQALNLYPNPASGSSLNVEYSASKGEYCTLNVYDYTGRQLNTIGIAAENDGENISVLNISTLPTGMYYIEFLTSERIMRDIFIR
jgi:hypothetical protein